MSGSTVLAVSARPLSDRAWRLLTAVVLSMLVLVVMASPADAASRRAAKSAASKTTVTRAPSAPILAADAVTLDTSPKAWTVMVYLDGDNNLDYEGWWTMDAMVTGLRADSSVNVFVLYDHEGGEGAEEFLVTSEGIVKLADVPEPDMSSADTLEAFVTKAMTEYPADRFMLNVWDHGGGWIYVCKDEVSGGRMYIPDMAAALDNATTAVGKRIDLVAFEACSMATIEVAYQLAGSADVVCGTEVTMDEYGPPWGTILAQLEAEPQKTATELGKVFVDEYVANKIERRKTRIVAQYSAIETAKLAPLVEACDGLAGALTAGMDDWYVEVGEAASFARCEVWMGFMGVFWFADVWTFADQIQARIDDPVVDEWASGVKVAFAETLYELHPTMRCERLRGLTVNWPPNEMAYSGMNYFSLSYDGIGLRFPDETAWDEMLKAYYVLWGNGAPEGSTVVYHHRKG